MFFKTPKKRFLAQKNVRFLSSFFNRAKEAKRMIGSSFTRPPFSSACKALWGDDAISFLALAVCAQFRFFYWKQQASCRDLQKRSWCLFGFISLSLSTLPTKKLKKNPVFRERRSFVISIFQHWKSTDRFFLVCLWKMNSHAKWSWMCVLQKTLFFVKAGGRFVTLHWIFFQNSLFNFLFRWRARNYKSPCCVCKTRQVVWSLLVILGFLITKLSSSIYRLFDPNKLCYFTVKPFGSSSSQHLYSRRERVIFMKFYGKKKSTSLGKSPIQSQTY